MSCGLTVCTGLADMTSKPLSLTTFNAGSLVCTSYVILDILPLSKLKGGISLKWG